MGDLNQLEFVQENLALASGPVLEVGSRDYGNTPSYRAVFPGAEYVGIDMLEGDGVDLVLDLTTEYGDVSAKLNGQQFNTIICMSVLEHVSDPFKAAKNMAKLTNPNGTLFVSVPFSWRIHGYPNDYWRFTPEGVRVLFPEFDFDTHAGNLTTSVIGRSHPIDDFMMRAELDTEMGLKNGVYGRFTARLINGLRRYRIMPFVFRYPCLFPPVMVNMIGIKR